MNRVLENTTEDVMLKIVLLTLPDDEKCIKAVNVLNAAGIPYERWELTSEEDVSKAMFGYGTPRVPSILLFSKDGDVYSLCCREIPEAAAAGE